VSLRDHLRGLPKELAEAIESEYKSIVDHSIKQEWDDAQVDAGRFSEAALRYLEYRLSGSYTVLDGKSSPNRKSVVGAARQDVALPSSLRQQVPQCIELMMDFRNSRNAAHLGAIDANRLDASCVGQLASWTMAEIVRLETAEESDQIQATLDQLAERQIPIVHTVGERPIVLDAGMGAQQQALILLYTRRRPVAVATLRNWVSYQNASRWRKVLQPLVQAKDVFIDDDDFVHLLPPGERRAQSFLLEARAVA
jgi:hypothetical protein